MRVTTAEFIKNYGSLADKALMEPVTITKNGRDRLVVVSIEEYSRLVRRDRRVIRPEELTEEQVALIAKSSVAIPTNRESKSCSRSSFGPKRAIA